MLSSSVFLLLSLSLIPLSRVLGQGKEGSCGEDVSIVKDIASALEYYSRCTYPTDKINVDCILSNCSLLKGVCPLTSNGSVDQNALSSVVSILNACIQQNCLICDINMTRIPLALITISLAELVPQTVATGTASIIPGTGFLDNLSHAKFSLPPQEINPNGSITLLISAPNIVHFGNGYCKLSIGPGSFLGLLPAISIPNMTGILNLNLFAKVTIDLSASPSPTIHTDDCQFDMHAKYTNFIGNDGAEMPPEVVKPFNDMLNSFLKESPLSSTTTNFLATYAALGLQAAQLNCLPK